MLRTSFHRHLKARLLRKGPRRKDGRPTSFLPSVEQLASRLAPAISAFFSAGAGTLTVLGDATDNGITLSTTAEGQIQVNGGEVTIRGGAPTAENTDLIVVNGLAGNDSVTFDETNGELPGAIITGGAGLDTITGGAGTDTITGGADADSLSGGAGDDLLAGQAGNDTLVGNTGDDSMSGQSGDDMAVWNNGDGSDDIDGGAGTDTVEVNGSAEAGDEFEISADGSDLLFSRVNLGAFDLNISGTEDLDVNGLGGDDTTTVNDFSGTGLESLDLDGGEGTDTVEVNGDDEAGDEFEITAEGSDLVLSRTNLEPFDVGISGTEVLGVNSQGGDDLITVGELTDATGLESLDLDAGAGNDVIDAALAGLPVTAAGGEGDDQIFGGTADDIINSGAGSDLVFAGDGADVVTGGDGDNTLDGGEGDDVINSGAGADLLTGGAGEDVLSAGDGDDVLEGGEGDDVLDGGGGDDLADGGPGMDTVMNAEDESEEDDAEPV